MKKQTKELSATATAIQTMKKELKQRRVVLSWMIKHAAKMHQLDLRPSFFSGWVDFDNLPHKDIIKLIKAFPGVKWSKTPTDQGRVDYETEFDGMKMRVWRGEPPPSCKIVEEEVYVPARTEIVRRLVCPKQSLAAA